LRVELLLVLWGGMARVCSQRWGRHARAHHPTLSPRIRSIGMSPSSLWVSFWPVPALVTAQGVVEMRLELRPFLPPADRLSESDLLLEIKRQRNRRARRGMRHCCRSPMRVLYEAQGCVVHHGKFTQLSVALRTFGRCRVTVCRMLLALSRRCCGPNRQAM